MTDRIKAWQCIGCGRIDGPQNCIGICEDRKVEFVYASEHDETVAQLELAREQVSALSALVRRLASTKPREHEWEHSYRALQQQAQTCSRRRHAVKTRSATRLPCKGRTAEVPVFRGYDPFSGVC